ncbi:MAG: hypothetical protein RL077_2283 [Verrucomicrobiota bacterium]|jgi:FkbM family methyltransferase
MNGTITLSEIIAALPEITAQHARTSRTYALLEKIVAEATRTSRLAQTEGAREDLGGFGTIELPYTKMGAVDTLDLFGLDELIIFAFYWANRSRYKKAADIGANIGLHSILMSRCGWRVRAYEPDPTHAGILSRNLKLNAVTSVELVQSAVSDRPGRMEFVRVLGNTTSSHLAGAKSKPYGELERFEVSVESIAAIMGAADFVKMDAEGQEKIIILGTGPEHWRAVDMIVEVGSPENAEAIFAHLTKIGVNAFAQKLGWGRVTGMADMPTTYKQGSLFLTAKAEMPW